VAETTALNSDRTRWLQNELPFSANDESNSVAAYKKLWRHLN
jgi:hypothetical protein